MKYFTSLYNSFLISLLVSLVLFTSEWLEMRVNVGTIFFGVWILLFVLLSIFSRGKLKIGFVFTLINLIVCLVIGFILYGIDRLLVVPASIIREGIHMTSLSFSCINLVVGVFILIGLVAIFIKNRKSL